MTLHTHTRTDMHAHTRTHASTHILAAFNKSFSAHIGHEAGHLGKRKCFFGWTGAGELSATNCGS